MLRSLSVSHSLEDTQTETKEISAHLHAQGQAFLIAENASLLCYPDDCQVIERGDLSVYERSFQQWQSSVVNP